MAIILDLRIRFASTARVKCLSKESSFIDWLKIKIFTFDLYNYAMLKKHVRIYENLHIPFWLVKDSCWAIEFKTLGVAMIVPTLALATLITIRTRKHMAEFLPNAAIALWISANSIWMCDEFFELGIKQVCYIPFTLGLIIVAYWMVRYFPKIWKGVYDGSY